MNCFVICPRNLLVCVSIFFQPPSEEYINHWLRSFVLTWLTTAMNATMCALLLILKSVGNYKKGRKRSY